MITFNKVLPDGSIKPIKHKGDNPERIGKIMTQQEIHEFGLDLLIVYLHNQGGELIRSNANIGNEYPHLVLKNPKGELLYVWLITEVYPNTPNILSIENREDIINLANQFNAMPVFSGIRLICVSASDPLYRESYIVEFTGLISIKIL